MMSRQSIVLFLLAVALGAAAGSMITSLMPRASTEEDYIASGSEPGSFSGKPAPPTCVLDNGLGC